MSHFCLAALHAAGANIINLFIQPDAPECFAKHFGGKEIPHFTCKAHHALLEVRAFFLFRQSPEELFPF